MIVYFHVTKKYHLQWSCTINPPRAKSKSFYQNVLFLDISFENEIQPLEHEQFWNSGSSQTKFNRIKTEWWLKG